MVSDGVLQKLTVAGEGFPDRLTFARRMGVVAVGSTRLFVRVERLRISIPERSLWRYGGHGLSDPAVPCNRSRMIDKST
jgi:hypothetical protein